MKSVILADVCDISSGGTPSRAKPEYFRGSIPWAKISDIENSENGVVYSTEESISAEGLKNIRGKTFPKGTLLFAMYGSIGKTAIAGKELSTNQAILGITPKNGDEISISYLKAWFESNKQTLINQGRGVALKNLSATIIRNLEIKLPPLDDQIRIAHLLGKVEGLIDQRKQHLQQLDDLLKSVFLAMFGPGSPGHEDWPLVEIRDLAAKHKGAMRTGPFGSNLLHSEFASEGDVAVLGIDNAVQNSFAWGERRFISKEKYQRLQGYRVLPGDVIVTIMGTIGRSAVIPDDIPVAINTKHLAAITLNREAANPLFLSYAIHSSPFVLRQFASKNRGAIMSGLNLGIIKETKIKRAPIELQNRFAEIHSRVDHLKSDYQQSLTDLEALRAALSQQAFKGELDLARVALPAAHIEGENPEAAALPAPITTPVIKLPESDLLLPALQDRTQLGPLLRFWLEAYRTQLGSAAFSLDPFIAAAQTRLTELHPDNDFEWATGDYDSIKTWVFEALTAGALTQAFDDDGNRIDLRAVAE